MLRALLVVVALALLPASPAAASLWVASTAGHASLKVDAAGDAEIDWTDATGPHSRLVFANGQSKLEHRLSTADVSKAVAAHGLPAAVSVLRTPGGQLWALQSWTVDPGKPPE